MNQDLVQYFIQQGPLPTFLFGCFPPCVLAFILIRSIPVFRDDNRRIEQLVTALIFIAITPIALSVSVYFIFLSLSMLF